MTPLEILPLSYCESHSGRTNLLKQVEQWVLYVTGEQLVGWWVLSVTG